MILNRLWAGFFIIGIIVALLQLFIGGNTEIIPKLGISTFNMATTAFEISLGLAGIMAFWLGMMKLAEKGGLIFFLAKIVAPFFKKIFPEIPSNHPAIGAMMMNFAANMLGLDNAATPLGLKAMKELQDLNDDKDTASNSQIMFLVINTSSVTIIPVTIIGLRAAAGATNPADVFIPILICTCASTIAGLTITSIYQKINLFHPVVLAYLAMIIIPIATIVSFLTTMPNDQLKLVSENIAYVLILVLILLFVLNAYIKKINVYETFVEGAKEGFEVAVQIIPFLVAMLVSVAVFRYSGSMDFITDGIKELVMFFGSDTAFVDALPTAFMKPLSGGGARGLMLETMTTYGADSFPAFLSSIFQGSTETTFYVLAVYFGSVKIKNTRYAATCGLFADFAGIITAIFVAYIFYAN